MDIAVTHRPTSSSPHPAYDTLLQRFGATLRQYRQQRRLSHKALAARMGIGSSYISEIEQGKRNIAVLMLLRFAYALNVPAAWLLADLDTHPASTPPTPPVLPPDVTPSPMPEDRTMLLQRLGEAIRHYREERGLLQAALAAKIGVASSYICHIEQGHRGLSILNLVRMATALELPVPCLLTAMDPSQVSPCCTSQDTSVE